MSLDRMWDIAGCRCIVNSNKQAYKVLEGIGRKLNIVKINDHVAEPQPDGYRSIHVYVKGDDNLVVEIQLRNRINHNWATLVEISDFIFGERIKEKQSTSKLFRFHYLLSLTRKLTTEERKEIVQTIRSYRYTERLGQLLIGNYLEVRKRWLEVESNKRASYYLIEAKQNEPPSITSYEGFSDAESAYFKLFKENESSNVVLTHLPRATFKKISTAYSNYILSYHQFIEHSFTIIENLVLDTLKDNSYFDFVRYYDFYTDANLKHFMSVISEISAFQSKEPNSRVKEYREWINDVRDQMKTRQRQSHRLLVALDAAAKESTIPYALCRYQVNRINSKYNSRRDRFIQEASKQKV